MPTAQQFGDLVTMTVTIDTDLSDKEYYLVNLETTGEKIVNIAAGATAPVFVLCEGGDGSTTSLKGTIALSGRVKVKLGGTVAAGDKLTSNGSGLAITTTTDTNNFGLIALEDGVANDIIDALVAHGMIAG